MSSVNGSDTLEPRNAKPSAKSIDAMITKFGDERALFFGDSAHDAVVVQNTGIPCIVRRQGRDETGMCGFSADLTVADFAEWRAVFNGHKQPPENGVRHSISGGDRTLCNSPIGQKDVRLADQSRLVGD